MGVKTAAGKDKWYTSSVLSILKNEKYKGDALLQKSFTKDFLTHKRVDNKGEVPQYYVEGHHEGIVTADQFEQVQAEYGQIQRSWMLFFHNKVWRMWFMVRSQGLAFQ